MLDIADASAPELVDLVLTVLGAAVVTAAGVAIELAGVGNVLAGQTTVGAWEAVLGLLALYVGLYVLAYQRAWPMLRPDGTQRS